MVIVNMQPKVNTVSNSGVRTIFADPVATRSTSHPAGLACIRYPGTTGIPDRNSASVQVTVLT
jgi:hypothetical protein